MKRKIISILLIIMLSIVYFSSNTKEKVEAINNVEYGRELYETVNYTFYEFQNPCGMEFVMQMPKKINYANNTSIYIDIVIHNIYNQEFGDVYLENDSFNYMDMNYYTNANYEYKVHYITFQVDNYKTSDGSFNLPRLFINTESCYQTVIWNRYLIEGVNTTTYEFDVEVINEKITEEKYEFDILIRDESAKCTWHIVTIEEGDENETELSRTFCIGIPNVLSEFEWFLGYEEYLNYDPSIIMLHYEFNIPSENEYLIHISLIYSSYKKYTYSHLFTYDLTSPTIEFSNELSDWEQNPQTNVSFNDEVSGCKNYVYLWTSNATQPNNWNEGITVHNCQEKAITLNVDGEYYLWIKAVDNALNVSYRRSIGKFRRKTEGLSIQVNPNNRSTNLEINGQEPNWEEYFLVIDTLGIESVIINSAEVDLSKLGVYLLQITATDTVGNIVKEELEISVVDSTSPIIVLEKNSIEVEVFEEVVLPKCSVTDNSLEVISCIFENIDTSTIGTQLISVSAKDSSGNEEIIILTVIVVDTEKPTISKGENSIFEVNKYSLVSIDWNSLIKANDNYTEYKKLIITNNAYLVVNFNVLNEYIVTYRVEDESKNSTEYQIVVKVVDTTAPEIKVNPNNLETVLEVNSTKPNILDYFNITDNYDGLIVVTRNMLDKDIEMNIIGEQEITLSVEDSSGNISVKTIKVLVVDTKAPIITTNVKELDVGQFNKYEVDWNTFIQVTDNYYATEILTISHNALEIINSNVIGKYIVTYVVIDGSGNKATKDIEVDIVDKVEPIILGHKPIEYIMGRNIPNLLLGITAKDNYYEDVSVNYDDILVNWKYPGEYTIRYIAIDGSGNESSVSVVVNVIDETAPNIEVLEEVIYIALNTTYEDIDWTSHIKAADNSGVYTIKTNVLEVLNFEKLQIGEYAVTYTAMDESGNYKTIDIKVEVIESYEISINKDTNIIIDVFSNYENIDWKQLLEISHYKYTNADLVLTDNAKFKANFNIIGLYEVNFQVTSPDGFTIEKTLVIEVVDNIAPKLENVKKEIHVINESKIDDSVILRGITIEDNYSAKENIQVAIVGDYNLLVNGKYEVKIIATDEAGNSTEKTVTIIVEQNGTYAGYIVIGSVLVLIVVVGIIALKKFS